MISKKFMRGLSVHGSKLLFRYSISSASSRKMSPKLDQISNVDIDTGKFKYVLIKVHETADASTETSKHIVRGYKWASYHCDVYEKVRSEIEKDGLDCECVGGGRILHNIEEKKINIYGYSQGYGLADHSISCDLVKKRYPDYEVKWSNEGY